MHNYDCLYLVVLLDKSEKVRQYIPALSLEDAAMKFIKLALYSNTTETRLVFVQEIGDPDTNGWYELRPPVKPDWKVVRV